jgi:outer membrane receptor for ferrienterochelin and colicins
MMSTTRCLAAILITAACLLAARAAPAQSVDYGGLEQVFGEPVTASVTGKPQRATDAPANVEIITQDDIRRSGATSIPDVLEFVTGLDVRRDGLASADVGIRGYNSPANPYLMVLVDGRQVYMVDYGRIVWANIPVQLAEIRQIEVIKGPNSALYGFNAVGGVINIITYDPLVDHINTATLSGGTQGYTGGSAVASGGLDRKFGVRLSLGDFRAQDFAPGPLSVFDQQARQSPFDGAFNLYAKARPAANIEGFANASMANTRTSEQSPGGPFDTGTWRSNSVRVGVSADTAFGLLSLSAYRNEALLSLDSVAAFVPIDFAERQTSQVVQASDLLKFGTDHTLRFELEYRSDAEQSRDFAQGTIGNNIYSASVMWDWQITPRLSLTNAFRVDYQQLHYSGTLFPGLGLSVSQYDRTTVTQPSFNTGLVWKVTDEDTVRFMVARGVQLPTLLLYGLQTNFDGNSPVLFSGRPDLRPAVIWNEEIDYDRSLPSLGSTLRTALFAQRLDDILASPFSTSLSLTPSGVPVFFSGNVGYSTAVGAEIGIRGHAASGLRPAASSTMRTRCRSMW